MEFWGEDCEGERRAGSKWRHALDLDKEDGEIFVNFFWEKKAY